MVLRESDPQTTIWELLLPEEASRLPAELQVVDAAGAARACWDQLL
jgi:hypothetical protein